MNLIGTIHFNNYFSHGAQNAVRLRVVMGLCNISTTIGHSIWLFGSHLLRYHRSIRFWKLPRTLSRYWMDCNRSLLGHSQYHPVVPLLRIFYHYSRPSEKPAQFSYIHFLSSYPIFVTWRLLQRWGLRLGSYRNIISHFWLPGLGLSFCVGLLHGGFRMLYLVVDYENTPWYVDAPM